MRVAFIWFFSIVLLLLGSCDNQSGQSGRFDLAGIQTIQQLKEVEVLIDQAILDDPELDGGHEFGLLAAKAVSLSRLIDGERLFHKALLANPDSPDRKKNLEGLSSLYRVQWKFELVADFICCQMTEDGDSSAACCPGNLPEPDSIQHILRDRIVVDSLGEFSRQAGREYLAFCQSYAILFPGDLQSAVYLNEAAKLAASLRMPAVAVKLYQWIYQHFKTSEIAPKARFLEAFTLENELRDLEAARAAYQGFLKDYPEDVFAKDARILLDNLGKDPEEIIRQFERQNQ